MTNYCKDQCYKYKQPFQGRRFPSRYSIGAKFCKTCQLFIMWEGNRCPCCQQHLRTKPRKQADKISYNDKLLIAKSIN